MLKRSLFALLVLLAAAAPARAQWTADGGVLIRGKIVTMDDKGTVIDGALLVRKGKIESILPKKAPVPAGAVEIDTKGGVIFPGLLNLHNHIAYNFLPLYSVPKHYDNRDQWPGGARYETYVNNPKTLVTNPLLYDRQTEALKYAEIKALVGGETTIQGSPQDGGTSTILVRNVELPNFGEDKIGQRGLPIDQMFIEELAQNQASVAKLSGWFFHLSEGISQYSREEYFNQGYDSKKRVGPKNHAGLKNLGLVLPSLIGIHCTALHEEDYADWKAQTGQGAKVVWSPLSNLLLYGKTTDVIGARRQGALVALGTDWSPSGSKNLLWELKVADQVNKQKLGSALTSKDLVSMVTSVPAKLVGWQDRLGSIKVGMFADLVIVDGGATDPYRALIDATETNVQLVLVGGDPLYGDEKFLAASKVYAGVKRYELIPEAPGRAKALDLKRNVPKGDQSYADVKKALLGALRYDPQALADVLNKGRGTGADQFKPRQNIKTWLAATLKKAGKPIPADVSDPKAAISKETIATYFKLKFPNMVPLDRLDSLYQVDDAGYFTALGQNLHLTGAAAVLDVKPLDKYRRAATSTGLVPSVSGATGTPPQ